MINYVAETGSTNADLAYRLGRGDLVWEGDWLVADRQTKGRGRQGREWFDGFGNFMGSTVVHLTCGDPPIPTLALMSGMAVRDTCASVTSSPEPMQLKWPNDLMIGAAKVAGILLERQGDHVVVGIGVNLANAPSVAGRKTASLADFGLSSNRDEFAEQLTHYFGRELDRWRTYGLELLLSRWQNVAHPKGTRLQVHDTDHSTVVGTFDGLADDGSLTLRLADGTRRAIHAGDVTLN
ncbi:MAG: biotin--[acetyl-CoA-carboxylase] ligase [Pontixanthobacter sp.]